jgi:hypothetical protein
VEGHGWGTASHRQGFAMQKPGVSQIQTNTKLISSRGQALRDLAGIMMVVMDSEHVIGYGLFRPQVSLAFTQFVDAGGNPTSINRLLVARDLVLQNLNARMRRRKAGQHDSHHAEQGAESRKARHQCALCVHHTGDIRVVA